MGGLGLPRCVATGVRQKLLHKRQESHLLDHSLSMLKFELLRKGVCQIKHDRIALENNRCYQDKVCEEHQSMKKCTLATKINTVQNMKETPSAHILDDVQSNAITSTTASPIPEISSHKMHHKCHNSALDSETDHKLAKERNRLAMYCMFLQHQMNAIAVADILCRQQLSLEGCSPTQASLVARNWWIIGTCKTKRLRQVAPYRASEKMLQWKHANNKIAGGILQPTARMVCPTTYYALWKSSIGKTSLHTNLSH